MGVTEKKIAVIGLGYVGLPLAVEFGKKQQTIGFDVNNIRVNELKEGLDTTREVQSIDIKNSKNLKFSSDLNDLKNSQIFIITVPTPIDNVNRPDLRPIKSASKTVGKVLKKGDIVIYESTVYPGCTEEECVPVLEEESGLKFNLDFFCGYSPERMVPGDKVNTLTNIKKITSGSTPEISEKVDELYRNIINAGTHNASSIKVAEAAKVIENTQRDLNIALVNELSLIFDLLDIDTLEVLETAGSKWNFLPFRPGMVGGHCIGVDPYYLTHKAEQLGYHPQVILAGRKINDEMARNAAKNIIKRMIQNEIDVSKSTIAIFGVTFKDNCPDIRNSKVFDLVEEFESWGINVKLIDPWADKVQVKNEFGYSLVPYSSSLEVDSVVVAVGHQEFKDIDVKSFKIICKNERPVFGDLKSIFSKEELESAGFSVIRL